ncbi:hypothetical protein AVEN_40387-1, partial [Araneus ventricosus]
RWLVIEKFERNPGSVPSVSESRGLWIQDLTPPKTTPMWLCTLKGSIQMCPGWLVPLLTMRNPTNCQMRPQWPGGKVSTSRSAGSRLEPDSTEEPPCKRVWCKLNPSGPNALPLVW